MKLHKNKFYFLFITLFFLLLFACPHPESSHSSTLPREEGLEPGGEADKEESEDNEDKEEGLEPGGEADKEESEDNEDKEEGLEPGGEADKEESEDNQRHPSIPQNFITKPNAGEITLLWEAPEDDGGVSIVGYELFRDGELITTGTFAGTRYIDNISLTPGVAYLYALVALNSNGKRSPATVRKSGLFDPDFPPQGYTLGESGDIIGTSLVIKSDTIGIYANEYQGMKLSSLVLPDTLAVIGRRAFFKNILSSVTIPDSVISIGQSAFRSNQLSSVTIPDSITSIGWDTFRSNQLSSVTIPYSVTSIGRAAFRGNQLSSVTIPGSVTSISENAFRGNQLSSVTIPDSVTSIKSNAFRDNQLSSVTIPNSVASIARGMFQDNRLSSVTIPYSVTSISENAFRSNQLSSVTIPYSVISIGKKTFINNPALETVTLSQDLFDKIKDDAAEGTATKERLDDVFGSQVTRYQKHDQTELTP